MRHLQLFTSDPDFSGQPGAYIRVLAPGQFGAAHHGRLYSLVDVERGREGTHFSLCVRRWHYIDEFNGQRYAGVASNFLCNLRPDERIAACGAWDALTKKKGRAGFGYAATGRCLAP